MKVLELCTSQSIGGLELYFLSCCKHLSGEKSIEQLSYVIDGSPIHHSVNEKKIVHVSVGNGSFPHNIIRLLNVISTFRPDIIHTHIKNDLLPVAVCKLFSRHSFKHVHTRQMNMPHRKKDPFHRFLYGQVDYLIAITQKLKNELIRNISIHPDRVKLLYYGVPVTKKGDIQKIEGLQSDTRFKIGLIARIDRRKEQHLMIEAVRILKKEGFHPGVYMIGGTSHPDYEAELRQLIDQHQLADMIKMTGFVDQPNNLMPYFDLIVLTTGNETFGLALIEGMMAGVAVIGANGGGVPEIIDHEATGLLFQPGNAQDLADQIRRVMSSKSLRLQLARNGKKKSGELFNEKTHFQKLIDIFSEACGQP